MNDNGKKTEHEQLKILEFYGCRIKIISRHREDKAISEQDINKAMFVQFWNSEGKDKWLNMAKLRALNSGKKAEEIYFIPMPENGLFNVAFVDDCKFEEVQKLSSELCIMLVQTSQEKYQLHIKFDSYYLPEEIRAIQKWLQIWLKGDQGATAPNHPRRVPGYNNNKYDEPFFVRVVVDIERDMDGENIIVDPDKILEESGEIQKEWTKWDLYVPERAPIGRRPIEKVWPYYYQRSLQPGKSTRQAGDEGLNQADMAYAEYIYACGVVEFEEMKEILVRDSGWEGNRIKDRKRRRVDRYIRRILYKAKRWYNDHHDERYDKRK